MRLTSFFPVFGLVATLFVTACASTGPSRPSAGQRPVSQPSSNERWRAVPARADGVRVQGGRMHSVKRGETGIAIARAYGVPWSRIAAANRIARDSILEIGQSLFIPTQMRAAAPVTSRSAGKVVTPSRPARPMTPEERAAAFTIDIDDLITGSAVAGETRQPRAASATAPARPVASSKLAWPTDGRVLLSSFGRKPGGLYNDGINIRATKGQAVRAAADGTIIYVGDAISSFGLLMLVRHPDGLVTAYGHLEAALAARGDTVTKGQPIGRAGSSGSAREPQLLFQVRQGRKALDPMGFLPA